MNATKVTDGIWWVGALDWDIVDFHGYALNKGTTYNAYMVKGTEKTVLFDTVKNTHTNNLIKTIKQVVDNPKEIDYLVINHVEPDHSGSYREIVDLIEPEKIITTASGAKELEKYYGVVNIPFQIVKSGDTVDIGGKTLYFLETKMIHWPDSMFTYIPEDKVLISQDGFGEHWATSERFDDEVDFTELMAHCKKYYANILPLYSNLIAATLKKVIEMGIEIKMILPDHGVIWRSKVSDIINAYINWSSMPVENKAVIMFDSMWHSTEMLANEIARGLSENGVSTRVFKTTAHHRSDIATEVFDAKALIFGSPTLNNGIMPTVADILCYIKGFKLPNRIGAAFGSYGWSGESVKITNESIDNMKITRVNDGLKINYKPTENELNEAYKFGCEIAEKMKEN